MDNLDNYVEKVKEWISTVPDITEELIVRYVYLDLGKRFHFDINYRPFGDSKKRNMIYRASDSPILLNKCMETNNIICNSLSNILVYVLRKLGVNIVAIKEQCIENRNPHVYNSISPRNGGPKYTIDLQEDLYYIQMHAFTKNFGLELGNEQKNVISRFEQETMDRQLGYITDDSYYTDDYIYTLKTDMGFFDTFNEKVGFILENIEAIENKEMGYADRQWYHVRILENFFSEEDFDYNNSKGKIHFIDCYKEINDVKHYINVVVVDNNNNPDIYIYNERKSKYCKIDIIHFAHAVKSGLIILHNSKIKNLNKTIKELKDNPQLVLEKRAK